MRVNTKAPRTRAAIGGGFHVSSMRAADHAAVMVGRVGIEPTTREL